jgi:hypothetical protein
MYNCSKEAEKESIRGSRHCVTLSSIKGKHLLMKPAQTRNFVTFLGASLLFDPNTKSHNISVLCLDWGNQEKNSVSSNLSKKRLCCLFSFPDLLRDPTCSFADEAEAADSIDRLDTHW